MSHFPGRGEWIWRRTTRTPDRVAPVFEGTSWSHAELGAECARVAAALSALGVRDRLKDIIISGGENISSSEVEQCLLEHPGVADAAVVGEAHKKWGEVPLAYVVLQPGSSVDEEHIRLHAAERLAGFKQPAEYRFVPELPRNASGKLLKSQLRQLLQVESR